MDCNFLRRNQISKRACTKQILQIMLLLLICVWLLYQTNQSRRDNRTERFGGEITIFEEYKTVLLGRKVIPSSWLNQDPHFAAESETGAEEKSRRASDQKGQEINHEKYSKNINEQINDEKDGADRFYRFHDENGVPPEEGSETEPYGNGSGFSFRKEMITRLGEMNIHEAVIFSGDVNDVEGNSESIYTHSDTSGISIGYSSVL